MALTPFSAEKPQLKFQKDNGKRTKRNKRKKQKKLIIHDYFHDKNY